MSSRAAIMMKIGKISEFMRQHLWTTILGAITTTALSVFGLMTTLETGRVVRYEQTMLDEYKAVSSLQTELYRSVDMITLALANDRTPDSGVIETLNTNVLELNQKVDLFNFELSDVDKQIIYELKGSLAELKREVYLAKSKDDLEYLAGRVALLEQAYQAFKPIVAKKIGAPNSMISG